MSRPRASPAHELSREYQTKVEFISRARHNFSALNQPERKKPSQFCPTHNYKQASPPLARNIKIQASTAFIIGLLAFIAIVVGVGLAINQGEFTPASKPHPEKVYQSDSLSIREQYGDEWIEKNRYIWED